MRGVIAEDRRLIVLRVDRERDQERIGIVGQLILQSRHATAHTGARTGTAREDKRRGPNLTQEIALANDLPVTLHQGEITNRIKIDVRRKSLTTDNKQTQERQGARQWWPGI